MNNDKKVTISISISKPLLKKIMEDIEGKNRSAKITKCVQKGFDILNSGEKQF